MDGGAYLGYEEMVYAQTTGATTRDNLLQYLTDGEPLETICAAAALGDEYDAFLKSNAGAIDDEYSKLHDCQSSIRGIKIRGSYESLDEAQARAEKLRKNDPNFNVYVASVGCWCPWSPDPEDIKDAKYAETELNTLMMKYKENVDQREEVYGRRKQQVVGDRIPVPAEGVAAVESMDALASDPTAPVAPVAPVAPAPVAPVAPVDLSMLSVMDESESDVVTAPDHP